MEEKSMPISMIFFKNSSATRDFRPLAGRGVVAAIFINCCNQHYPEASSLKIEPCVAPVGVVIIDSKN